MPCYEQATVIQSGFASAGAANQSDSLHWPGGRYVSKVCALRIGRSVHSPSTTRDPGHQLVGIAHAKTAAFSTKSTFTQVGSNGWSGPSIPLKGYESVKLLWTTRRGWAPTLCHKATRPQASTPLAAIVSNMANINLAGTSLAQLAQVQTSQTPYAGLPVGHAVNLVLMQKHGHLEPTSAAGEAFIKNGEQPMTSASWHRSAEKNHIKLHGRDQIDNARILANSRVSDERPGFRDRYNGDVSRYDRTNQIYTVITHLGQIKTGYILDEQSFYRLATTNYFNKTGRSVADLGRLAGQNQSNPLATARDNVLADLEGKKLNRPETLFQPYLHGRK